MYKKSLIYKTKMGTIITNYKPKSCKLIEYETSIRDEVYHRRDPFIGFNVPYKGTNAFITYDKPDYELETLFKYHDIVKFPEIIPTNFNKPINLINVKSFKSTQTEALGKFKDSIKDKKWFINLQTSSGKTLLSVYISTIINVKTWVLCYSTDILSQWVKEYKERTDIDHSRILLVDSGATIKNLISGKLNFSDYDIFLSTPGLLTNFMSTCDDYSVLNDLFTACGIGLLIYDEAHRNVSNLVKIISTTDIKYQLYLSADFCQGEHIKDQMYKKVFKNITLIQALEAEKTLKYTKLAVVEFNTNPRSDELLAIYSRYGYSEINYIDHQMKKGVLQEAISFVLDNIFQVDTNHKILILLSKVSSIDTLYEALINHKAIVDNNISMGRFHKDIDKTTKEWVKNDAQIIISTYKSFSTGLNVDEIKYVLSTDQCNKVRDNQSAGRSRPLSDGSEAIYFMFIDKGYDYCRRKLKVRLNYLMNTKSNKDRPYIFKYYSNNFKI